MSLYQFKKGDIVRIHADLPPGLEDIVAEGEEGEYAVSGKLATVVRTNGGNSVGVKIEGLPRDTTWSFDKDDLELVMKGL